MALTRPVYVLSRIPGIVNRIRALNPDIPLKELPAHSDELSASTVAELGSAEILLADPALIKQHVNNLPRLRWMQSTWAGVDAIINALDKDQPLPSYKLSRFGGYFGAHMAEYVIGQILCKERQFIQMYHKQQQSQWSQQEFQQYRLLSELTVGILGLGDIGKQVAHVAHSFGMRVLGLVSREVAPEKKLACIQQYYSCFSSLPSLLEQCDYVVSILPSTPSTRNVLSGNTLQPCQTKRSTFINLGRGDVIDDTSLIHALNSGWLRHAILDVTSEEPLPRDNPLWSHNDVTITPHVSAVSFDYQVAELFVKNYEQFTQDGSLDYLVSWQQQY